MKLDCIQSLAAGLGLAAGSLLQSQEPSELAIPRDSTTGASIRQQASDVFRCGDRLRVNGPDYRAAFDALGTTFTPALGAAAPRTMTFRLEPVSIARGSDVVWKADACEPAAEGKGVRFEHSPGLFERFDATSEGLELSWSFDDPIAGTGDLVVRYRVISDLRAGVAADGVAFLDSGLGGVTIGTVTGIDAEGESCTGRVSATDEMLALSLPGAFVDSAKYPLVLDPLMGSSVLIRVGTDDEHCDVAYDDLFDRYLFVWQTVFSATDCEIRGQLTDALGTGVGIDNFLINSPSGSSVAMRPRVATVEAAARFLVVWQEQSSIFGYGSIGFASVNPSTGVVSGKHLVSGGGQDSQPEVGNGAGSDNDALVVFARHQNGIRGIQIDVPSMGEPSTVGSLMTISTGGVDHSPTISDASLTRRVVAWIHPGDPFPRPQPDEVRARATTGNLSPVGTELRVYSTSSLDPQNPSVDGDGERFFLAWDCRESTSTWVRHVWCRMLSVTTDLGTLGPATTAPSVAANANDDDSDPAVAMIGETPLGRKFVLAWTDGGNGTTPDSVIGVMTIDPEGCFACGTWQTFGGSSAVDFGPAIASRMQSGDGYDHCMIAFTSADRTPPFDPDVWGQRFQAFGAGGSTASLGGACGLGGNAYSTDLPAVGNVNFRIRLSGANGAIGGVLVIDTSPPVNGTFDCGYCTVLTGVATLPPNSFDGAAGTAIANLPLPCAVGLIGGRFEAQWLTINFGASPCPIVPNVSASNRLQITIGE